MHGGFSFHSHLKKHILSTKTIIILKIYNVEHLVNANWLATGCVGGYRIPNESKLILY